MDVHAIPGQPILIGWHGENAYRQVLFDVSGYLAELPSAAITLLNRLPGESTAYPATYTALDGGTLIWTVTSADTSKEGTGECELLVASGGVVAKSIIYSTKVGRTLDGSGAVPDQWESWQTYIAGMRGDIAGKVAKPTTSPNGSSGQLLRTNGDGSTEWSDVGLPTDAQTDAAVSDWLDDHPEAVTTVQDNSLGIDKLTGEARQKLLPALQIGIDSISTRAKWAGGVLTNYYLQAVCYDSYRDRYVIGCSHVSDSSQSKIFVLDGFSFANSPEVDPAPVTPSYQHCNDMAYDAVTDHIFIASGDNEIYEIDASDLSYYATHEVDSDLSVWQISAFSDGTFAVGVYDSTEETERLLHYNSDFSESTEIRSGIKDDVLDFFGISSCTPQGSFMYDDVPYMIYNETQASGYGYVSCIIASFDSNGITLARRMRTRFEVECACSVGDTIHWLLGNDWIATGVTNLACPEIYDQQRMQTEIPSGADLDDYVYEGYYYSPSATVSATLDNMPNATSKLGGFTLSVIRQAADFVRQVMYSNTYGLVENMYTRVIHSSEVGPWYTFTLTRSDGT